MQAKTLFKIDTNSKPPRFNAPGNIAVIKLLPKGDSDAITLIWDLQAEIKAMGFRAEVIECWYYTQDSHQTGVEAYCAWQFSNDREREQFELMVALTNQKP